MHGCTGKACLPPLGPVYYEHTAASQDVGRPVPSLNGLATQSSGETTVLGSSQTWVLNKTENRVLKNQVRKAVERGRAEVSGGRFGPGLSIRDDGCLTQ